MVYLKLSSADLVQSFLSRNFLIQTERDSFIQQFDMDKYLFILLSMIDPK